MRFELINLPLVRFAIMKSVLLVIAEKTFKLKRNVFIGKMALVYWWTHWFWITAVISARNLSATPLPFSSYETISTSLKSALIQNENSFQQTGEQQKITSKSAPVTFETSDTDDLFGGAGEIDAENTAKNKDFLTKPSDEQKSSPVHVELEKSENVPADVVASLSLPNAVNSTNNSTTQVATTMLSSVTESASNGG